MKSSSWTAERLRRRSLAGRVFSFATRTLACVVIIVLIVDGWFADDAFRDKTSGSDATAEATGGRVRCTRIW